MPVVPHGELAARLLGRPAGIEVGDGDRLTGPPPPVAGLLNGIGFQTTASVGERRWRRGPAQWELGPANEEPPPTGGWWHATEIVAVETIPGQAKIRDILAKDATGRTAARVRLATDDPEGRELVVDLAADWKGCAVTLTVDGDRDGVEAVGCAFAARDGERWLGFGERSDRVVRSEGVVEFYVGEGTWQEYEYPFLGATVPPWGVRQRRDATYFPVPWLMSTAGYGVAILDDAVSYARLRPGGRPAWSVEIEASSLTLRFLRGGLAQLLRRYVDEVGVQAAPEPWWWGPWYQTGHDNHVPLDEERRQLALLRSARAPISAAETHCRYLPIGEHRGHEEGERSRVEHLHGEGLAVLAYLNPLVSVDYPEAFGPADRAGVLLGRAGGGTYTFEAYAGGREPPVTLETHYDFGARGADRHWAKVAEQVVDAGYDGWMEDFGEYTPLDAIRSETAEPAGTAGHNRYATEYHATAAAVTEDLERRSGRRLARFVRSGWRGTAAVAPIVWGGDPTTGWGFNGLASAIVEGLSAGMSGVAMWGSDIGGFVSSVERLTPELLIRWIQFGACSPVMRTKSAGIQGPDVVRPQIWDGDVLAHWTRWAAWHTQLQNCLTMAHDGYRRTGRPIMRPLAFDDPSDEEGLDIEDQYRFLDDLLIAPVLTDGARTRSVHVPPGEWIDLWRSATYDPATRAIELTGGARIIEGPTRVEIPAPLAEIPILVRAGTLLPLLSADVDSLSPYRAPGVVNLHDRFVRRLLWFLPDGEARYRVAPGEEIYSEVDSGEWWLNLADVNRRCYEVRADLGLLEDGRPAEVDVRGARTWSYDPATGVLAADVDGTEMQVTFHP